MPSHIVERLMIEVAELRVKVEKLEGYQKWQIGLLTAIFMLAVKNWVR